MAVLSHICTCLVKFGRDKFIQLPIVVVKGEVHCDHWVLLFFFPHLLYVHISSTESGLIIALSILDVAVTELIFGHNVSVLLIKSSVAFSGTASVTNIIEHADDTKRHDCTDQAFVALLYFTFILWVLRLYSWLRALALGLVNVLVKIRPNLRWYRSMRRLGAAFKAKTSGLSLILPVALHSTIDSIPACLAVGPVFFGSQYLIETTQDS